MKKLFIILALATVLSGCGNSSRTETDTHETITTPEGTFPCWIEKHNDVEEKYCGNPFTIDELNFVRWL